MKAKFTAILLSLLSVLAGSTFAYADGPGQPPYIEPTEEIADSSVESTDEPTVNPYEELYLQQTESNEEMSGLLLDIKELISGLKPGMEITPTPVSVPEAVQMTSASEQTPDTIPEPEPEPEPTEIPKVTETTGNGYIVEDMQQLNGGMEFLTMASKDGSVFYMVIDRNKDNEVYLLNKVDNADLEGFVEETPVPEETASPSPSPSPTPTVESTETPTAEQKESTDTKKSGNGGVLIILLLAAAGGGAVYWFKFRNNGSGGADNDDNAVDSEFETDDEAYPELNGNEVNEDEQIE